MLHTLASSIHFMGSVLWMTLLLTWTFLIRVLPGILIMAALAGVVALGMWITDRLGMTRGLLSRVWNGIWGPNVSATPQAKYEGGVISYNELVRRRQSR